MSLTHTRAPHDIIDTLVDKLVTKWVNDTLQASSLHNADLDNTMLGIGRSPQKPGHLAPGLASSRIPTLPVHRPPGLLPFQPSGLRAHRQEISPAAELKTSFNPPSSGGQEDTLTRAFAEHALLTGGHFPFGKSNLLKRRNSSTASLGPVSLRGRAAHGNALVPELVVKAAAAEGPPPKSELIFKRNDLEKKRLLSTALLTGIGTGLAVVTFKTLIAVSASALYTEDKLIDIPYYLNPVLGGIIVAGLTYITASGTVGPTLANHIKEVEDDILLKPGIRSNILARTGGAVVTLGSGNSMGPEGPAVEIGVALSRFVALIPRSIARQRSFLKGRTSARTKRLQRQLVAAGSAAGVSAGFNAPLTAIFFTLEVVNAAVKGSSKGDGSEAELDLKSKESIFATAISAIAAAAMVQLILGSELALRPGYFVVQSPVVEIPLSAGLGALCGVQALAFEKLVTESKNLYNRVGGKNPTPTELAARPLLGAVTMGLIAAAFPQVLFFGYSTINEILANGVFSVSGEGGEAEAVSDLNQALNAVFGGDVRESSELLGTFNKGLDSGLKVTGGLAQKDIFPDLIKSLELLAVKLAATSACVGSGLVGGTFAPTLFFGAALGCAYHDVAASSLSGITQIDVAGSPAYALIGAAASLASIFRCPITAALLVFEISKRYEIVVPALIASGAGNLVIDQLKASILKKKTRENMMKRLEAGEAGDADERID